jgi:hypothetical protein
MNYQKVILIMENVINFAFNQKLCFNLTLNFDF